MAETTTKQAPKTKKNAARAALTEISTALDKKVKRPRNYELVLEQLRTGELAPKKEGGKVRKLSAQRQVMLVVRYLKTGGELKEIPTELSDRFPWETVKDSLKTVAEENNLDPNQFFQAFGLKQTRTRKSASS